MFPFFLKFQQNQLKKSIEKIGQQKVNKKYSATQDSFIVMKNANDACTLHNNNLKTPLKFLLSFVPFSKPFRVRLIAANSLSTARTELQMIKRELKNAPVKNAGVQQRINIQKSHSDSEIYLQKKQYSKPFSKPFKKAPSLNKAQYCAEPAAAIYLRNN